MVCTGARFTTVHCALLYVTCLHTNIQIYQLRAVRDLFKNASFKLMLIRRELSAGGLKCHDQHNHSTASSSMMENKKRWNKYILKLQTTTNNTAMTDDQMTLIALRYAIHIQRTPFIIGFRMAPFSTHSEIHTLTETFQRIPARISNTNDDTIRSMENTQSCRSFHRSIAGSVSHFPPTPPNKT